MQNNPSAASTVRVQKTLLGHPAGLFVLFFAEMWERFSYYGMRALLVLYMTKYLIAQAQGGAYVWGFQTFKSFLESFSGPLESQPLSSLIYGTYSGLVYFTPFFGGILADQYLGQRKTVYLGGILMAIGHFLMAIESMFLLALIFIIAGNGAFKPNISTQVGLLYPPGDPRRDRAFTIFYMGVNLGAFFAPLVCGTLGQKYGWHYGFTAAGFGMLAGLVVYWWGQQFLAEDQISRDRAAHKEHTPLTQKEWMAIGALCVLCALNILFFAIYEQQGNTLQLYADERVNWHVLWWDIPSTWFQALNPALIFITVPLLNMFWGWQSKRGTEPGSVNKMAMGVGLLGLSFLVLYAMPSDPAIKISLFWLFVCTWIYTIGEIYLSPIGLSLVSKVAPPRLVSMLMGAWFMAYFAGNFLSGVIGAFYTKMSNESFFLLLCGLGVADALAIFAFSGPLKKAFGRDV